MCCRPGLTSTTLQPRPAPAGPPSAAAPSASHLGRRRSPLPGRHRLGPASVEHARGRMRPLPGLTRRVFGAVLPSGPVSWAAAACGGGWSTSAASRGLASSACGGGGGWRSDRHQGEPGAWHELGHEYSHHAVDGATPNLYSLHASEWQQQHYLLSVAARRAAAEAEAEAGVGDRFVPVEVNTPLFCEFQGCCGHCLLPATPADMPICVVPPSAPTAHPAAAGCWRGLRGPNQPHVQASGNDAVGGRGGGCDAGALCRMRPAVGARLLRSEENNARLLLWAHPKATLKHAKHRAACVAQCTCWSQPVAKYWPLPNRPLHPVCRALPTSAQTASWWGFVFWGDAGLPLFGSQDHGQLPASSPHCPPGQPVLKHRQQLSQLWRLASLPGLQPPLCFPRCVPPGQVLRSTWLCSGASSLADMRSRLE